VRISLISGTCRLSYIRPGGSGVIWTAATTTFHRSNVSVTDESYAVAAEAVTQPNATATLVAGSTASGGKPTVTLAAP
jgi:hypothetical protein